MSEKPEVYDIVIQSVTGNKLEIKVTAIDTVHRIKEILEKSLKIPESECILVFNEQELKDEDVLRDVGVRNGSNLFLAVKMIGGPLYMGAKMYGPSARNLRDVLERTKKSLGKKYSTGCRVLVLLYKDQVGNHHFVKVYDENDNAKVCQEEEDKKKNNAKRQEASDHESAISTESDQAGVVKRLHEEMQMKMKVNDLRKKMKEVAEQKRMRKSKQVNEETVEKEACPASTGRNPLSVSELNIHDKILLFTEEFSYTDFMKCYNDKCKYNEEMLGYTNLTFRLARPNHGELSSPPLVMRSEGKALKEENRSRSHRIVVKSPQEEEKTRRLRQFGRRKREEVETMAFGLRQTGASIPQVEERLKHRVIDVARAQLEPEATQSTGTMEDLRSCVTLMNLDKCRPTARPSYRRSVGAHRNADKNTPANTPADRSVSPPFKRRGEAAALPLEEEPLEVESGCSSRDWDTPELARAVWCGSSEENSVVVDTDDELDSSGLWTDLDDQEVPERTVVIRELPPVVVEKVSKCSVCKRRLNVVNRFDCSCGKINCPQHRYAETHECKIDYRKNGRETLTKQNPRIVGEKVKKI